MVTAELITELSDLDGLKPQWDDLAVASQLPMMSPACVLAWWRHLAPPTTGPRVIVVRDEDQLLGIAPFYVDLAKARKRLDLRLPGMELAPRLAPLARPGHELDVAKAISHTILTCEPRPHLIALEAMPLRLSWASALREHWPTPIQPLTWRYQVRHCPAVTLDVESYDAWLATKSSKFRHQMRRVRREFASSGGTVRAAVPETLEADIATLMRLHLSRWENRGKSGMDKYGDALPAMLLDMGNTLLQKQGRFLLWILEIDGRPICADLSLCAGGHVLGIVNGWDERFAQFKPAMLSILNTIEEAFVRNDRVVDLSIGDQPYKLRFADTSAPIAWTVLMPIGVRLPQTYLSIAMMAGQGALRNAVKRRMSSEQINRYRGLSQRLAKQARTI